MCDKLTAASVTFWEALKPAFCALRLFINVHINLTWAVCTCWFGLITAECSHESDGVICDIQGFCVGAAITEGALRPCPWLADFEKQLQAIQKSSSASSSSTAPQP